MKESISRMPYVPEGAKGKRERNFNTIYITHYKTIIHIPKTIPYTQ
jgi:hypothetical protein